MRLTTAIGTLETDPRSAGWIALFRRLVTSEEAERFIEAAVSGVPASIEITTAGAIIDLTPAGRRHPIRVTVAPRPWTESERDRAVQVATSSGALAAALLAAEVTAEGASELAAAGLPLPPPSIHEAIVRCECPAPQPCEHAGVALLFLADLAVVRPIEMLTLRGHSADWLVERVRQQRAIASQGVVSAHPEPRIEGSRDEPPPLGAEVDRFWVIPQDLNPPDDEEPVKHASHALLRRMGPSPLGGRFPIVGLLASIYDEVSRRVREQVEQADAAGTPADESVNPAASADQPPPP